MRTPILLLAMTLAPHAHAQFWREDFNGPTLDPRWSTANLTHLRYDLDGGQFNVRGFSGAGQAFANMSRDAGPSFEFDFRTRVTFDGGPEGALSFTIGNVRWRLINQSGIIRVLTGNDPTPIPISPGTREFRAVGANNAWSLYIDGTPVLVNSPITIDHVIVRVGFSGVPLNTTRFFPCSIDYIEIMPVPAPGISASLIGAPLLFRRRR